MLKIIEKYNSVCPHENAFIIHCVSKDGAMGAGFAKNVPYKHKNDFRNYFNTEMKRLGGCVFTRTKQNKEIYAHLITKERSYFKPTYLTFAESIAFFFRRLAEFKEFNILEDKDWHSPLIGCGLDKLEKDRVLKIIHAENDGYPDLKGTWTIHILGEKQ